MFAPATFLPSSTFCLSPPPSYEMALDALVENRKRGSEEPVAPPPAKRSRTNYENYGKYDSAAQVHANHELNKYIKGFEKKRTFWYFLLCLLTDSTKKDVVCWTGTGLEFKVVCQVKLTALWSREQGRAETSPCLWESIQRNFRACYKKRIFVPNRTVCDVYAFVTEPTIHMPHWSRERLDHYIREHCRPLAESDAALAQIRNSYTPDLVKSAEFIPVQPVPELLVFHSSSTPSSDSSVPEDIHSLPVLPLSSILRHSIVNILGIQGIVVPPPQYF